LQEVVRRNLDRSALYGGEIAGRGPRYCPSIEDKVVKFPDAARHQVFLEPEGLDTHEVYVNGLSTSLPVDVQIEMLRTVPGLEAVQLTRMGYAIEYDYFPPHQLRSSLELKALAGLFLAGQINGTTGYEEAAGQGLLAGANAAFAARDLPPLVLERDEGFIGVLIDDLVTKGTDEPYRLFTSRAEFRLLLRQDNALARLGPLAAGRGLLTDVQRRRVEHRLERAARAAQWAEHTNVEPEQANGILATAGSAPIREPVRVATLLKRPNVSVHDLLATFEESPFEDPEHPGEQAEVLSAVEMELRYAGYLARERSRADSLRQNSGFPLPDGLDYDAMNSLSIEARQKLGRIRPSTLGQASRIPGISPSDLQNLVIEVRKRRAAGPAPLTA
ncbi:MAG: FAD-dependent oxidoreductase, partial [Gemmatimonadota bacterium]